MNSHLLILLLLILAVFCDEDFTMSTILKVYDMTIPPKLDGPTGKTISKMNWLL